MREISGGGTSEEGDGGVAMEGEMMCDPNNIIHRI